MNNDIIPQPSIINIIGASVGRALGNCPIQLHCVEANINHEEFSAKEKQLKNVAGFLRSTHSLIARGVNKSLERKGPVVSRHQRNRSQQLQKKN